MSGIKLGVPLFDLVEIGFDCIEVSFGKHHWVKIGVAFPGPGFGLRIRVIVNIMIMGKSCTIASIFIGGFVHEDI